MISLKCDSPVRIRNQYTGQWMYVNCRKCSACLINKVNTNCVHLLEEVKQYPFSMMLTLTYDNDNIPYMVRGSYDVYRGVPSRVFPKVINRFDDLDISKFESVKINGFPQGDMTSVINYKDFQKFFKRLRVYYERKLKRKFPYRYHCLCEYGTFGKRAHGHILFFGQEEFDESFRNAVIACWKLHDWTKLPMAEVFKTADAGVASYITSYVNSLSCCDGFFQRKGLSLSASAQKKLISELTKNYLRLFKKVSNADFVDKILEVMRTICDDMTQQNLVAFPPAFYNEKLFLPILPHLQEYVALILVISSHCVQQVTDVMLRNEEVVTN